MKYAEQTTTRAILCGSILGLTVAGIIIASDYVSWILLSLPITITVIAIALFIGIAFWKRQKFCLYCGGNHNHKWHHDKQYGLGKYGK